MRSTSHADLAALHARIAALEATNRQLEHDVQQLQAEQDRLQALDAQRQALLDAMPDLMFRMGADGIYRDYKASPEDLDSPVATIIGTDIREGPLPKAVVEKTLTAIQAAIQTGVPQVVTYSLMLPNKGQRHYEARVVQSGPDETVCIVRDQTEHIQVHEELQEQEQFIRKVADTIPGVLYVYDLEERRNVFINREVWSILGYTTEDVQHWEETKASSLMHPEDRAQHHAHFAALAALPDGASRSVEYRMQASDGTWHWLYSTDSVMSRTASGGIKRIVGVSQDITERKAIEDALRESQAFAERVTDAVPSILYIFDLIEQRNVFVNRSMGVLLGYTVSEVQEMGDQLLPMLIHREDLGLAVQHHRDLVHLPDGTVSTLEYRMRAKTREWRWILSTDAIYQRLPDGTPSQIVGTAQDITDQKRIENALRRKTAEFEAIYRSIPDAVVYADLERCIQLVNPAFVEIFGYTSAEVIGHTTAMLYTSEEAYLAKGRERFNLSAEEKLKPYEVAYRRKDGTIFTSETVGIPVKDEVGNVLGFLGLIRDVTEQREAEQALRESQQFIQAINDTLPDIVYVYDVIEQRGVYSNPAVQRVLGLTAEEVKNIGDQWLPSRLHPDDADQVFKHQAQIASLADGENCSLEYRLRHKDGTWRWLLSTDTIMNRLGDGTVHHVLGTAQDITERKQAEEALRASEERYRLLYNNTPVMLHSIDTDGRLLDMSDYWLEKVGYTRQEVLGRAFHTFLTETSKAYFVSETLPEFLKEGTCSDIAYELVRKDGHQMHVLLSAVAERDASGQIVRSLAVMVDVTERKQAEEALRASEERYRLLYNNTPVMQHVIDTKRHIRYVSDFWLDSLGYTRDEVLGRDVTDFLTPESEALARSRRIPQAIKEQGAKDLPYQFVKRNGEVIDVLLSAVAQVDGQGQVERFLAVLIDVTERKRAQQALQASEARYRSLYNHTPVMLHSIDNEGRLVSVSDYWLQKMGYTRDEVLGRRSSEFLTEASQKYAVEDVLPAFMREGYCYDVSYQFVKRNGEVMDVLLSAISEQGADGQIERSLAVVVDITARKEVEDALRMSEERYRSLYNKTPVMLHSIDPEGRLVSVSDYWLWKLGYTREEVLGQKSINFLTEEGKALARQRMPDFMQSGFSRDLPYQFLKADGTLIDVLLSAIVEREEDGGVRRAMAVLTDVTERKKAEAEREQYAQQLEETNKELEQFAYVASHDLQEPLRTITSFIKLLEQDFGGTLPSEGKEYMHFIVDASERMRQLIQDLLTYSRAGQWALNLSKIDLNDVVKHIQMGLQTAIEERGAEMTSDVLPTLNVDPMLMQLLFQNLLSNALKFKRDESPRVHVGVQRMDALWQFSVQDNGIGIKERYVDKIFEIFRRLHGQGKYKGTGIGLAICKKVVERHGGTIWVESIVGKGSTFYFTLPTTPLPPSLPPSLRSGL